MSRQPALPATLPEPADGPDLSTLLREFIALRQEINLLTRAARVQQEQNTTTLTELSTALESLREKTGPPSTDNGAALHFKQLMEVRDALGRAEREMNRGRATLDQTTGEGIDVVSDDPPLPAPPPWPGVPRWLGWLGLRGPDQKAWQDYTQTLETQRAERQQRREAERQAQQAQLNRGRQLISALLEGYTMSLQRLDRLLQAHGLEAIPAEGQRFDPERMEALETVTGTGKPAGEVVEEIRRGYTQGGRILRFALVRVARDG